MNKLGRCLVRAFWAVFSISMLAVLIISITKPLNNLIPSRMVIYTFVWVGIFFVISFAAFFIESKFFDKEYVFMKLLPFFLIVFGAALYIISLLIRSELLTDYRDVYLAAYNLATKKEVTNWEYFARWNNNVGCLAVLAFIFKIGTIVMGSFDVYYFVLFLNVVYICIIIRCVVFIAGRIFVKHSFASSITALVFGCIWLPFWANTSVFYTDQLTVGIGIFGFTLLIKGFENPKWYLYSFFAGVVFGIGIIIKVTCATLIIALVFGAVLFLKPGEYIKKSLAVFLGMVIVCFGFKLYSQTLPYQKDVAVLKAPVEYWIALGLNGSGTYGDSEEFAIECLTRENYEVRKEFARDRIVELLPNMWDIGHIIAKTRQNFGAGDLGAAGYFIWPMHENIVWNFVSCEGEYYWKYACLTTSFFFAWLFVAFLCGVMMFFKKEYVKRDMPVFCASLAFWGLCLFLMLWEAQDKQLYNHSALMLVIMVYSVGQIREVVFKNVFGHKKTE